MVQRCSLFALLHQANRKQPASISHLRFQEVLLTQIASVCLSVCLFHSPFLALSVPLFLSLSFFPWLRVSFFLYLCISRYVSLSLSLSRALSPSPRAVPDYNPFPGKPLNETILKHCSLTIVHWHHDGITCIARKGHVVSSRVKFKVSCPNRSRGSTPQQLPQHWRHPRHGHPGNNPREHYTLASLHQEPRIAIPSWSLQL